MPLQPGQLLNNRYRIVRLLGQGGFGAVYRAWDANLNRPCAVKENLDTSPEAHRQFTREATILANLSHPNLPRVTDHFSLPDQGQYLVMDFVEGDDLASLVKKQGSLPLEGAGQWIAQVAEALSYLHNRQPPVVHRDVKPENIRITPDGLAMLVDFGLVKLYDPQMRTTLGARAVTPGYAPPEQYGQGKTDPRTDQYALAATLYNLLTGKEPLESVHRMAGGLLTPAHQVDPRLPESLGLAIDRAMSLEPDQRFPSVNEFRLAIVAAVKPTEVVRPVSPPPVAVRAEAPRPAPPSRSSTTAAETRSVSGRVVALGGGLVFLLILCLAAMIAVGGVMVSQQRNAQRTAGASIQETRIENVRSTSTAQALLAITAQVQITEQARSSYVRSLESSRVLVYGPASGSLAHKADDDLVEIYDAGVNLRDFILEVRLFNPYPLSMGSWDYGFMLRHEGSNTQYRFIVKSDKTWALIDSAGDPDGVVLADGQVAGLDTNENGSNQIRLIFQGERGLFYLNGSYIGEFDLSSRMAAGGIQIATGIYTGDEISGYSTRFSDFTIWSIP